MLLFPRAADATAAAGRRFWPTVGWGALVGIVGPVLGVLVLVTIVGIPFGLGILSALNVLAPLGYVASSLILGRLMVKGTSTGARIGAFFAGFGILRAAALIPGIGFLVWFLVCIYGLGALDAGGVARRSGCRDRRAAVRTAARRGITTRGGRRHRSAHIDGIPCRRHIPIRAFRTLLTVATAPRRASALLEHLDVSCAPCQRHPSAQSFGRRDGSAPSPSG